MARAGVTPPATDPATIGAFVAAVGPEAWAVRLGELRDAAAARTHSGRRVLQYHAIELALARLLETGGTPATRAERLIGSYAADAVRAIDALPVAARDRFRDRLRSGLRPGASLVAPFHLLRTAAIHRARGFAVQYAGVEDGAPFDLLITRQGAEAEVACDLVSAEDGRGVHRGAWFDLVDRIDPELQGWLRMHPGRYLLKLTLPAGLRDDEELLGRLHARITAMLAARQRTDGDAAAMLRLDPLMLAAAQSDDLGLMPRLRREFGPEAQLAVTAAPGGIFVMAARAGTENEVACAVRRRLQALAPARLTGTRPGILAVFLEDTDRLEWRDLRERLSLEGEARQFMTRPEARGVVAVTCASRFEMFGLPEPDSVPGGELRFRNPAHGSAKSEALTPAISSSM